MQAQYKPKSKAKSRAKPTSVPHDAPDDPAGRQGTATETGSQDQSHDDTDLGQAENAGGDAGNLRSELFALREQSLDAFQALVCSIVRHEKENKTPLGQSSHPQLQHPSPTSLNPSSHATSGAASTSVSLARNATPSSAQSRDGSTALCLADALLLDAPTPPTNDPSASSTPASARRSFKPSLNHPSATSAPPLSPSHSAAASLLQVLSQKASPSARRRHSVASLSSISSSSPLPSSPASSSANTQDIPSSPRTSSGMMKSLRSRFRSNSISAPQPEPIASSPATDQFPAMQGSAESPVDHFPTNPIPSTAPNVSTASMDLAFALASLLEDVTSLLASDSKPSTTDFARVQAAMDELVVLVDLKKAAPVSIASATDTMCDSPSASQHHDGMLESGTAETASVHTVGPDADYRHGFDGDKSKENAKQKRYSAEPPPYDAHDFEKQKHTSSTRLGVLKEKLPSEKRSLSEPASPTEMELEKLVITIERLNRRGRLDDQAVHLTTRQRDQLEDAAITARIGRLARGRFEDQRAVSSANEQTQLMAAITDSNKTSSLTNQRVEISSQMQRRMELARLGHLADRLANSGRMEDQDAVPKRVRELDHLARELERLSRPSGMDSQRYTMNDAKEKDMFLSQMAHRVSRLTDCRMEDQAADGPGVRKAAAFTEVDQALDRMAALSSHLMDGQRYHV